MNLDDMRHWTVLIVDDEQDNLGIAEYVLQFHGMTVYTAQDGVEGLATLNQIIPTLILLDLSMPKLNGWEMLQAIRRDVRLTHLPVIALTAHAMIGDRERALEAGFDDYITKPFRVETLLNEMMNCMDRLVQSGKA